MALVAWTPALVFLLGLAVWQGLVPHCMPAAPCHGPFGWDFGPMFWVGTVAYWIIPLTGPVLLVTGLVILAVPFRWAWRAVSRARGRAERGRAAPR